MTYFMNYVINLSDSKVERVWDARKCPSYSKKSRDYRKDRWNNSSAMRGQPSINCQGHSNEIKAYPECSLSVKSIRRRLVEAGLNGRVARKKPLVSLKNRSVCVGLTREHLTWSAVD
uniref:HTH_Tnp_Tc3_2 domain-containing protein n=1 Tax=Heterorhabditis bacteriophora TaxID=37862 RepID=A0A1I7XG56_HETBA